MNTPPSTPRLTPDPARPAVRLQRAEVRAGGRVLLTGADWHIDYGQHWTVLGRNGAGKSTLLSLLACTRHPTNGTADVLGHRLGTVDLRELRRHIGLVTTAQRLLDSEGATALTVVLTGKSGTIQPLWNEYDGPARTKARALLALLGCEDLLDRPIRVCSQGERARVRIARALMADPALLLLDEPFGGLDLPAREDLITALENLARTRPALATVTVTHHLEEVPATTTHALLVRDGHITHHGTPTEVLTDEAMSDCFGRPLHTHHINGRWYVQAAAPNRPPQT
ncbi:ABC transporter ATP-binding protein [Streptomyces sp. NPDC048507]|uniref:ABC transporter ATP-binding protein n=1 Tax=Streptomyces sp. NPDC048507 TaxID=3365560 RepID=UPI0037200103